jgi:hypothetical protein
MKRENLLAIVEKAVGRAMRDLAYAHPQALQGYVAQSIEKRLIGALGSKMLRAAGHPPDTRLRAPGEHYRPSQASRAMQSAADLSAKGTACLLMTSYSLAKAAAKQPKNIVFVEEE